MDCERVPRVYGFGDFSMDAATSGSGTCKGGIKTRKYIDREKALQKFKEIKKSSVSLKRTERWKDNDLLMQRN